MTLKEDMLETKLKLLLNFGAVLSQETNLEKLLGVISSQVKTILACDKCYIFLIDPVSKHLSASITRYDDPQPLVIRMPFGKGIAGFAAENLQTIILKDVHGDPRFNSTIDELTNYFSRSVLVTPIKNLTGKIVGVFEAVNKFNDRFTQDDASVLQLISTFVASAIENARIYERLHKNQLETILRLATTAEYRDQEDTALHLRNISEYSRLIAEGMDLPQTEIDIVRFSSPLHDIGKVGIPDAILLKPAKLTPEEFEEMKKHTLYGEKILSNTESDLLRAACKIAVSHHEKYNGKGYPRGIGGEEIPLYARIVSVADVFDALCMKRVYKPKWDPAAARRYILNEKGKSFDPKVVEAFDRMFDAILNQQKISRGKNQSIIPGIMEKIRTNSVG